MLPAALVGGAPAEAVHAPVHECPGRVLLALRRASTCAPVADVAASLPVSRRAAPAWRRGRASQGSRRSRSVSSGGGTGVHAYIVTPRMPMKLRWMAPCDNAWPLPGTPGGDAQPAAQPESELRALIAVAAAVAAAHRLEDVLEVVAEETCRVVGASSVSISRWDREHDRVRTLINVGELGPGEERFPTDETYALADYPLAARLLRAERVLRDLARRRGARAARPAAARRARQGLLHRRAGDLRRAYVGQARDVRERRCHAVHAPPRAVPGGDRRAGGRRDRPRGAVLARQRARLRGPAHRPR